MERRIHGHLHDPNGCWCLPPGVMRSDPALEQPANADGLSLDAIRSRLRASGEADLEHARHLRRLLTTIEAQQVLLATMRVQQGSLSRMTAEVERDGQRMHADLLSLLSIIDTVDDRLSPSDRAQVDSITRRWVKEGGR